jgi:hypothetical protein
MKPKTKWNSKIKKESNIEIEILEMMKNKMRVRVRV